MTTIAEMRTITKAAKTRLLSDYPADFWADYRENYEKWDAAFARRYASFFYYAQDDENTSETPELRTADFTEAVYMHLWFNDKKYTELYRLLKLNDMEIVNSYNVTATETRNETRNGENVKGKETEQRTNTAESTATGNTSNNETIGARHDSNTFSKGEESAETINKVSPYDTDGEFQDNTATQNTNASRIDNGTADTGEQSNEATGTSKTITTGTNSDTTDRSERHDTATETTTATVTTERHGNIGNSTQATNAQAFVDFWEGLPAFYDMIFSNIIRELCLVA